MQLQTWALLLSITRLFSDSRPSDVTSSRPDAVVLISGRRRNKSSEGQWKASHIQDLKPPGIYVLIEILTNNPSSLTGEARFSMMPVGSRQSTCSIRLSKHTSYALMLLYIKWPLCRTCSIGQAREPPIRREQMGVLLPSTPNTNAFKCLQEESSTLESYLLTGESALMTGFSPDGNFESLSMVSAGRSVPILVVGLDLENNTTMRTVSRV